MRNDRLVRRVVREAMGCTNSGIRTPRIIAPMSTSTIDSMFGMNAMGANGLPLVMGSVGCNDIGSMYGYRNACGLKPQMRYGTALLLGVAAGGMMGNMSSGQGLLESMQNQYNTPQQNRYGAPQNQYGAPPRVRRRTSTEHRRTSTERRRISTERRRISTERRRTSTERRRISTERRRTSTERRRISTERGRINTERSRTNTAHSRSVTVSSRSSRSITILRQGHCRLSTAI